MTDSNEGKIAKKIPVSEIFSNAIQGEGELAGTRTTFIRFGLCDYKCVMCDSMHAVDPVYVRKHADWLTQDEIADKVIPELKNTNTQWVTFSGGNPCMHDLYRLASRLHTADFSISVETQGTLNPGWLHGVDQITVSPKSPGMGEKFDEHMLDAFMTRHNPLGIPRVSLKVVIFSAQDLEFAGMIAERYPLNELFLSVGNPHPPELEGSSKPFSDQELRDLLIERYKSISGDLWQYSSLRNARLMPQMHVLAYGNARGR